MITHIDMLFQSSSSNKCHSRKQSSNLDVCRRKPPWPVLYSKWAKHKYYNSCYEIQKWGVCSRISLPFLTLVDLCPILLDDFKTCRHWRIHHPSESLKIPSPISEFIDAPAWRLRKKSEWVIGWVKSTGTPVEPPYFTWKSMVSYRFNNGWLGKPHHRKHG